MYEYLKGVCVSKQADGVVLDVNGVGYSIRWAGTESLLVGETVQIYVQLQIKEDAHELYGFSSVEDREMFRLLLSVKSIGPKVAQQILNSLHPAVLAAAILRKDVATLTGVKGLGKKGAERILVELHDKIQHFPDAEPGKSTVAAMQPVVDPLRRSAAEALWVLGFSPEDSEIALGAVFDAALSLEDNIRLALKQLQRR